MRSTDGRPPFFERQLTRYLGTGGASAFAAALLLSIGGSAPALAQQVSNLPLVRAVVKTTSMVTTPLTASANANLSADVAVAREANWLQRNGWPLYALVDKFS